MFKLPNCLSLSSFCTSSLSWFKEFKIDNIEWWSFSLSWILYKKKKKYYIHNKTNKTQIKSHNLENKSISFILLFLYWYTSKCSFNYIKLNDRLILDNVVGRTHQGSILKFICKEWEKLQKKSATMINLWAKNWRQDLLKTK